MIRKSSVARPRHSSHSRFASVGLEPLEQRQMLDAAYINEIYIDPPSGGDVIHEYIELRGTPGMSLDNYSLLIIENENDITNSGHTGEIEKIFDLNGQTMGADGFLTYRKAGNSYTVAPGTTDLTFSGELENSGFTAMLIKTDGAPANVPQLNYDLDVGNDGLDNPNGHAGWTILDSIGVFSEAGEANFGRLYGKINFGPEPLANVEPGSTYVSTGFEIEYIGRWGNSTGQTADDWHASNLTDNALSGFTNTGDFRQSADPHGSTNVESNKNVPYGTNITGTLGAPNIGSASEIFINEIYFDPPSSGDILHEYIELRGTPNMSLDNYFLVFLENENDIYNEGGAGDIEKVFDLTGYTMGSNGYLTFREVGNNYTVAPGTTDLFYTGVIENSGFTAMLIRNNGGAESAPVVNEATPVDLDTNNDGLDVASGNIAWDVMDSIGVHSEADEIEFGRLYGMVNYGPGPNGVPIDNYHNVGFEIEYVGRWGNSTGSDEADWHVSNLTDNALSGFTNTGDFRQSADPHGSANVESNHNVPYGTNLTNTLGAENYPLVSQPATTIVGRHIFYNQSKFDGNSAAVNASDDAAIAPDKSPYFAGTGIAPTSSVTSYSRGINGIMVDVADAAGPITASDFTFRVGANSSPGSWAAAPAPSAVVVRPGAGENGSDRVEITWTAGAIVNTWLQVTLEGNDAAGGFNTNTGLDASDVFYFGNRMGDTFTNTPAGVMVTNAADEVAARGNTAAFVGITNTLDFTRDNLINANDEIVARLNTGALLRINVPAPAPSAAPAAEQAPLEEPLAVPAVAEDTANSAVATALSISTPSDKLGNVASRFFSGNRLDLNPAALSHVFSQLADTVSSRLQSSLTKLDKLDAFDVEDNLLESLLDDIVRG